MEQLPQCVPVTQRMISKQPHNKDARVQAVQEWDDPLSHINHSSLPADTVRFRHCRAAEIPQFASKICFFQIWDTHTFLKRKYTEDTAVVGKKKNSDWVYGTWSSRMILARRCLLFHNWKNVFLAQIPEMKGLMPICIDTQKAAEFVSGQHPLKDRKSTLQPISFFLPLKKFIVNVNGGSSCCHYFEHPSATQRTSYQQFTTVSAANRLPALFVHLIYYLRKAIVNSHPNVCRALIQHLCKCTAREILVTSFQLFLTRYFLEPHLPQHQFLIPN